MKYPRLEDENLALGQQQRSAYSIYEAIVDNEVAEV